MFAYVYSCVSEYAHTDIHTHAHTHTYTDTHTHTYARTHTHTRTHTHSHAYTHIHESTNPCTNACTQTLTHTHTRTEIEHASFSLQVFSTSGGVGTKAAVVYKRLASMLSDKHNQHYSKMVHWLRFRLSLYLLRSSIRCLRGSLLHSRPHRPTH